MDLISYIFNMTPLIDNLRYLDFIIISPLKYIKFARFIFEWICILYEDGVIIFTSCILYFLYLYYFIALMLYIIIFICC